MLSFKELFFLPEATEIYNDEKGKHYISDVGPHKVGVHFFHNGNDRYEVGVDVNGSDDIRVRNKLTPDHRNAAVLTAMSHIRHFIKNDKPYELQANGNTRDKRQMYKQMVDVLHSRTPGAIKTHSDNYSKIIFPPTEDQAQKINSIKQTNLDRMKQVAAKRASASN